VANGLKKSSKFYGTGECFVFAFDPRLNAFRWTQKNQSFISSDMQQVMIGGGGGAAIWVDSSMRGGVSAACETFDSPILASGKNFKIVEMEIWSLLRK
jgi:hypothetical protein